MAVKKAETKVKAEKKSKAKEVDAVEAEEVAVETEAAGDGSKTMHAIDSKYRLILLAAQRSKQLQKGATIRVAGDMRKHKHTRVALMEIAEEKVPFEFLDEE
jgi:DNA-directed RNA polymerase omega subunit